VNPLRLAIAGSTGRMGQVLIRLTAAEADLRLVAAVTRTDDPLLGRDAGQVAGVAPLGVAISSDISRDCDVLIEFTSPAGCRQWADWCAQRGVALVSGTTGLRPTEQSALRAAAAQIPVVWSPNMSVGVNLLFELVGLLADRLDEHWDVELCETHHRQKIDAPSGTALALLEAICARRGRPAPEVVVHGRHGAAGPRPPGQIGVHALRMGSIVGRHEVHFASAAECLTLRHEALSRDAFALGALRAARWLRGRAAGMYSMRDVLFG